MSEPGTFRFFKDQAQAEEVIQVLENLGVAVTMECACIRDHKQDQCVDFMSSCRAGVYVEVPTIYGPILHNITKDLKGVTNDNNSAQ